ncbi:hypothetical protein Tco_0253110 [Tanacetum coccineum]
MIPHQASFQSKLQISPPSSNEQSSPQPLNPLLDNILDVPSRPSNPQPLQSHPSLDVTLSLSPFENLKTPSPPSLPQPQPPIMGHPLYYNYHEYHGSTCICCSHNRTLFLTLRDEMNIIIMSSSTHPIIILSDSNVEDAFSSTNTPDYTPTSPDYFPASPKNTFSDPSEDLSKDLLASLTILPFHDDPYMKIGESYHKTHLEHHEEHIETILNHLDELPLERIKHMEDNIEGLGNGRREQIRHDDEIVLARVRFSTLEMLIEDIQIRH